MYQQEKKILNTMVANPEVRKVYSDYMTQKRNVFSYADPVHASAAAVSEANWLTRAKCASAEDFGLHIEQGDVCYMDFGQVYDREMGYQHFGLVLEICCKKALVLPLTSNASAYAQAYDPLLNPDGHHSLMRIGLVDGLVKDSVLYLNDLRFVNTARVICVHGHIDPESELFHEIVKRLVDLLSYSWQRKV